MEIVAALIGGLFTLFGVWLSITYKTRVLGPLNQHQKKRR